MSEIQLETIPQEIACHILSFLPWSEKLRVCSIIPSWEVYLQSSSTWKHFSYDSLDYSKHMQFSPKLMHDSAVLCITQYGYYFQTCTLRLHNFGWGSMTFDLLQCIVTYCTNLKSVRLYHPVPFTFTYHHVLARYIELVKNLADHINTLQQLALCNMEYLALDKTKGFEEVLEELLKYGVHQKVSEIEYSHAYDFSRMLHVMSKFNNLVKLKCPVQTLDTSIITNLAKQRLHDLYVINDGGTLNEGYSEKQRISWPVLSDSCPWLRVHYIFQERTLRRHDLCENPLVVSFIMDSLCNSVTADLIESVADLYGKTLTTFVHMATQWNFLPYEDVFEIPNIFEAFTEHCQKLTTFVSGVEMPAMTLLLICSNRNLETLLVDGDQLMFNIDEDLDFGLQLMGMPMSLEELEWEVGELLCRPWHALSSENFIEQARKYLEF